MTKSSTCGFVFVSHVAAGRRQLSVGADNTVIDESSVFDTSVIITTTHYSCVFNRLVIVMRACRNARIHLIIRFREQFACDIDGKL